MKFSIFMDKFNICKDMTNSSYPNIKSIVVNVLRNCNLFTSLKECCVNFIIQAFACFLSIKGKINFLQMGRFSDKCEQYSFGYAQDMAELRKERSKKPRKFVPEMKKKIGGSTRSERG